MKDPKPNAPVSGGPLSGATKPPPITESPSRQWREAHLYQATPALLSTLELAIKLRMPLLITGEPGCGKTSAAYWAAWRMGLTPVGSEPLVHYQVRSDSSASKLKYDFDAVRYLREAYVAQRTEGAAVHRGDYVEPGPLWRFFERAAIADAVLLLDEIDKAPRDFPNDLLHEFDVKEFHCPDRPDAGGRPTRVGLPATLPDSRRLLIVCTSNGEQPLPPAFLRRCLHHHLIFDRTHFEDIVKVRVNEGALRALPPLLAIAFEKLDQIRTIPGLSHRPGMAEMLVWLTALASLDTIDVARFKQIALAQLPYLGALIKEEQDHKFLTDLR